MHDQANHLRQLVRDCAAADAFAAGPRPRVVLVGSGKGGVGTTTIAVNLAVAAARAGRKTVLVDADKDGGDVAVLCGLQERYTIADVLSGRRTATEVLQVGPGAVRVLPGVWGLERLCDFPAAAGQRLLGQLRNLGTPPELVVLDVGNGSSQILRPLCRAADVVLMVTTAEAPSVIDTYASIKAMVTSETTGQIHALVNRAADAEVARGVQARLAMACRRFLGIRLQSAGHVSDDPMAAEGETPFVIAAPNCKATRQIERLAAELVAAAADAASSASADKVEQPQLRLTA